MTQLGLPDGIAACLFDLDGVLTPTAALHAQAWKSMFDDYLRTRSGTTGERFQPFDQVQDYDEYVDGKPRADGVRSFLESRHITLPGASMDELAERKDKLFLDLMRTQGVEPYPGSVEYLRAVLAAPLKTAVVSSSKHCTQVLRAAGLEGMLAAQVDADDFANEYAPFSGPGRLFSRTRSRVSPPGARADSVWWSGSTAPGRPKLFGSTAQTSWSRTWPTCWCGSDPGRLLHRRAMDPARDEVRPALPGPDRVALRSFQRPHRLAGEPG